MKTRVILSILATALTAFGADLALDLAPAPAIHLKDSAGRTVTLDQYRGKVVLLDFWATWCTGCKQEMPWFVELQKKYGTKKFAVVGVSMDDDGWKTLRPFLKAHRQFRYKMLLGDQATADAYGWGSALPDSFLIDRKGILTDAYHGVVKLTELDARIRELLAQR